MNFLSRFFKPLFNQIGQTGITTFNQAVDPRIADLLLNVRRPSTGLLGAGAFETLGGPGAGQWFASQAGLPLAPGYQNLFRINPAEAEELGTAESKARENILQNTPMRGGELDQGLAQNIMHFGGLRNKLTQERRGEALNSLGALSGYNLPNFIQKDRTSGAGAGGPSIGSQIGSILKSLPGAVGGIKDIVGLLGLGNNTGTFPQSLADQMVADMWGPQQPPLPTADFTALNTNLDAALGAPIDLSSAFNFTAPDWLDTFSSGLSGFF